LLNATARTTTSNLLVAYPEGIDLHTGEFPDRAYQATCFVNIALKSRGRYSEGVLWSPSYFAGSCGGAALSIIKQHVEQQRMPSLLPATPGFPAKEPDEDDTN